MPAVRYPAGTFAPQSLTPPCIGYQTEQVHPANACREIESDAALVGRLTTRADATLGVKVFVLQRNPARQASRSCPEPSKSPIAPRNILFSAI